MTEANHFPADWLVPSWPAPARVRAVMTSRSGGVSTAPWDSMNLGLHVGDQANAVMTNRQRLAEATGARPVYLNQVHGVAVAKLDGRSADGLEADAAVTGEAGLACTIMVADCLPVLFAHRKAGVVAAAHAGWRGLCSGVLEATARAFLDECARQLLHEAEPPSPKQLAADALVWLGPCIGPTAFEVGPEVKAAFEAVEPVAARCFKPAGTDGKWLADLPALAWQRLQLAGLTQVYGNDGTEHWCTLTQASRFFSHRRDQARLGGSGRMAACIWLA